MKMGVKLPTGEVAADRRSKKRVFTHIATSMLLAQAIVSPAQVEAAPPQPKAESKSVCERVGSLCVISRMLELDMPVVIDTSEPVAAQIVTTTTTTAPPPPVSCQAAVRHVVNDIGDEAIAGWDVECLPGGYKCVVQGVMKDCDGQTKFSEKKVIIAPDKSDSTARRYYIVAHELGHVDDAKDGRWTGSSPDCATASPEVYCFDELEQSADAYARNHGYPRVDN